MSKVNREKYIRTLAVFMKSGMQRLAALVLTGTVWTGPAGGGWTVAAPGSSFFTIKNVPAARMTDPASPATTGNQTFSREQLLADYLILTAALHEFHPGLTLYEDAASLDRFFGECQSRLTGSLTAREFYLFLAPVLDRLHCCHTFLDLPSPEYEEVHKKGFLPFDLRVAGNRFFIARCLVDGLNLARGTEILAINGRAVPELIERFSPFLPVDGPNPGLKAQQLEDNFKKHYFKRFGGCTSLRLKLKTPQQQVVEKTIECPSLETINKCGRIPAPPPYEWEIRPEQDSARLIMRTFDTVAIDWYGLDYKKSLREFFTALRQKGIGNLIIDLRGNGGGFPEITMELLSYLVPGGFVYHEKVYINRIRYNPELVGYTDFPGEYRDPAALAALAYPEGRRYRVKPVDAFPSLQKQPSNEPVFGGRVFVLTDHRVMSATSDFLSVLKTCRPVTVAGAETGGAAFGQCSGILLRLELPRTKIPVFIPLACCHTPAKVPPGRGILPDHPVQSTAEDYLAGVDRELALVRRLIAAGSCSRQAAGQR